MSKFCPYCGAEVKEAKFCPDCGKPTSAEGVAASGQPQNGGQHQYQAKPVKKRHGCLIPILMFLVIAVAVGVFAGQSGGNKGSQPNGNAPVTVLMDAEKFAQASLEELAGMVGELTEDGGIELIAHDGTVVQGAVYSLGDAGTNFVIVDDKVVSFQYWAEQPVPYGSPEEIFAMFGIDPEKKAKKEADTGMALRYTGVSPKVSEFWVQSMDTEKKTFEIVKISYDGNFAGRLSTDPERPDLEVLNHESTNDGYVGYITGRVKNNTDKTYSYAQVSINLYSGDTQLGSTLANVNNLEPGGIWEFKAPVLYNNCDKYKIVEVIGY